MPRGLAVIDWDEFEGGYVAYKFPTAIQIPENLIQLLQISHSFNPGSLTIREGNFQALSIGIVELQKVIVLILNPYEDASDFREILMSIKDSISDFTDPTLINHQLEKFYILSQSVFKAREAVMTKLMGEITQLKNRDVDVQRSLDWLIITESDMNRRILLYLIRYGNKKIDEIAEYLGISKDQVVVMCDALSDENLVEKEHDLIKSLVHYQI